MKRVSSHVLIELDADAKKTIDRLFNRTSTYDAKEDLLDDLGQFLDRWEQEDE